MQGGADAEDEADAGHRAPGGGSTEVRSCPSRPQPADGGPGPGRLRISPAARPDQRGGPGALENSPFGLTTRKGRTGAPGPRRPIGTAGRCGQPSRGAPHGRAPPAARPVRAGVWDGRGVLSWGQAEPLGWRSGTATGRRDGSSASAPGCRLHGRSPRRTEVTVPRGRRRRPELRGPVRCCRPGWSARTAGRVRRRDAGGEPALGARASSGADVGTARRDDRCAEWRRQGAAGAV